VSELLAQTNHRILVIDDNRSIHDDFHKVLCPRGNDASGLDEVEASLFGTPVDSKPAATPYRIDSAYQGKEGLDMIKQARDSQAPYAMAFVDVRMPPGWDGIETTERLWQADPDLQVVICTAYSDYSWSEMMARLGLSDSLVILKKPFDQVEVLQLATSLTRKWQLLQESKNQVANLEKLVALRSNQVVQEQEKLKAIFDNSPEGIFQITPAGRLLSANPALALLCGYPSAPQMIAESTDFPAQMGIDASLRAELRERLKIDNCVRDFQTQIRVRDGTQKWVSITACKVASKDCIQMFYQGFMVDITARKEAEREKSLMEVHLRQAQKLESVGQLAAGIAHEINTPIQYIGDNVRFVEEALSDMSPLLTEYQNLESAAREQAVTPELLARVRAAGQKADIDYLKREIPGAIRQSLEGLGHVAGIVRAMKEFSHPGRAEKMPVDVNHAIETTLTVARNEWKYVADVITDLAPNLPQVPCLPGDFNQVLLNIIVNAAHAISDVVKGHEGRRGVIKISTRQAGASVEIKISDTGAGIAESIRNRVFEPFFTTKEVGRGTGQGLAIAYNTIVKKHGGELTFETEVGKGTQFIIRLPINPSA